MSQFYSEMLTWSVVGLSSVAAFLAHTSNTDAPDQFIADEPAVVASAEAGSITYVSQPVVLDPVPEVVSRRVADVAPTLPQIVQDAELLDVNFAANGSSNGLPPVASPDTGVVTGRSVNLRAGPGTGFQIVSRAAQNDALVVTGDIDGVWVQVLAPVTEEEAWIHGNYFKGPGA